MTEAKLHDGAVIDLTVDGTGPTLLLPVNPHPAVGPRADELRKWGMDPALGRTLIDGLRDDFRVVAFDYEGHVLANPKPDTLVPDSLASDLLAIADAVDSRSFAYYGYSWLALSGLQLALRTDRLSALVMGGFPPLHGPYAEMLRVTMTTYDMAIAAEQKAASAEPTSTPATTEPADPTTDTSTDQLDWSSVEMTLTEAQTRQFVTLYQALQGFDDRAAQARLSCPRLCFAGSADTIQYDANWGDVRVDLGGPLVHHRAEIEAYGWTVQVLDGLDHTQAMQPTNVLPVLHPWLIKALAA
ncbi:alpha/beta fold hydrolase [Micromonospora sp. NPDC003197]